MFTFHKFITYTQLFQKNTHTTEKLPFVINIIKHKNIMSITFFFTLYQYIVLKMQSLNTRPGRMPWPWPH